ncbi:hypothetical protein A2U01_0057964, partial [Trifolium medium]|nr:hypothetical protein [Trifolium medium]
MLFGSKGCILSPSVASSWDALPGTNGCVSSPKCPAADGSRVLLLLLAACG